MKTVYDSANDSANDFTNYEQYFTIKERLDRLNQNMQKYNLFYYNLNKQTQMNPNILFFLNLKPFQLNLQM